MINQSRCTLAHQFHPILRRKISTGTSRLLYRNVDFWNALNLICANSAKCPSYPPRSNPAPIRLTTLVSNRMSLTIARFINHLDFDRTIGAGHQDWFIVESLKFVGAVPNTLNCTHSFPNRSCPDEGFGHFVQDLSFCRCICAVRWIWTREK